MDVKHDGCFGCSSKTEPWLFSTSNVRKLARIAKLVGRPVAKFGVGSIALCSGCYGADEE